MLQATVLGTVSLLGWIPRGGTKKKEIHKNDTAGRIIGVTNTIFKKYGYPELEISRNIIPNDNTTLYVCSGMQQVKDRFVKKDNTINKKQAIIEKYKDVFHTKDYHYWYDTFGITEEEIKLHS